MMFGSAPLAGNPVEHYLSTVVGTNSGAYIQEQWPRAVRDLLIANQVVIQPAGQSDSDPSIQHEFHSQCQCGGVTSTSQTGGTAAGQIHCRGTISLLI
ncbi:hypothetical protein BDZ94DRAFT_152972 [Collybia nuda]|uniref:Uncharacterized protein n=1 Tax=Collybia nuda TaxID=64659 RepID=A0A9P5XYM7_9AGAR|nr:hypothetical protein BDZ94DRAFT_152972 [Collybia nuda]